MWALVYWVLIGSIHTALLHIGGIRYITLGKHGELGGVYLDDLVHTFNQVLIELCRKYVNYNYAEKSSYLHFHTKS